MSSNGREARRRRIVDKGSDRLALITGQIQNLQPGPESEPESESRHSHTASCPPYLSRDHQQSDHPSLGAIAEDKVVGHLSGNHDSGGIEPGGNYNYENENRSSPFMRKCESNKEVKSVVDRRTTSQVSSAVNSGISASEGGDHHQKKGTNNYPNVFTPYKIISAIKACETPRIRCSLATAVIVVLCYVGFPILGTSAVKSVVLFRPLFFLLLTNISIVVRHLLLEDAGPVGIQQEASNGPSADDTDLADQVGKALELGLMLQKIMGALFIDSSIYAISVICSLSFAQKLGW